MTMPIELLIRAAWVVPIEPACTVLEDHAVAVHAGRIIAILPAEEALQRYDAAEVRNLPQHVLIPGLVNLHTHAAMTLLRGLADDQPLMVWLNEHIWPAEQRHVTADFVHDGSLLACAEMLRGGITCFNDMYFFPEATIRATLAAGMRAAIGICIVDFPTAYANGPEDYLAKGLAARSEFAGEDLLSFCVAPHAPYTVSDPVFRSVEAVSSRYDLPVHIHLQETAVEVEDSLRLHGCRPVERLQRLGLIDSRLIGIHAVHLAEAEIDLLAEQGCSLGHCPTSGLKLSSGISPVTEIIAHGVNIGLGSDSAASNNRLDVFQEMRLAALLAKGSTGRADAINAHEALRMATLNGARALHLDDKIGSIQVGKWADLCAVDLGDPMLAPTYDPVSHLVYVAGREHVTDVWVAGRCRVRAGQWVDPNNTPLLQMAHDWQKRIRPRQDSPAPR